MNLKDHEEMFDVKPVGVRYRCELCEKGEMVVDHQEGEMIKLAVDVKPMLIRHQCTKCKGTMMLPKSYPYIEWIPIDQKEGVDEK